MCVGDGEFFGPLSASVVGMSVETTEELWGGETRKAVANFPVLLLWADSDRRHPLQAAEEALDLLPHGQLRVLSGTGFLIAYDDPVGVARELAAFCG